MTNLFKDLPAKLGSDGVPIHLESGRPWNGGTYKGVQYKRSFIKQVLQLQQPQTPRPRMSIITYANRYFLRNKDGEVHATRYKSREDAAAAAHKMASGLIQFQSAVKQVLTANLTNKL